MRRLFLYSVFSLFLFVSAVYAAEQSVVPGKAEADCFHVIKALPPAQKTVAFKRCMEEKGYTMPDVVPSTQK